ncbi:MAG: ATP-binding protein [Cytophagales bacterium]|nr:ATP-binding protein [Bernardetiaceae bacterium]MDW8205908.1 ATP-binding protein [Cytophagales bacterium]
MSLIKRFTEHPTIRNAGQQIDKWLQQRHIHIQDFRTNVILRIAALVATIFAFTYLVGQAGYTITGVGLGALIIFQIFRLIHKVESTNREVINFLNAIRYDDFSYHHQPANQGATFEELAAAFNRVITHFKAIRSEKEAHYQYLKTIIHHIGIGLISFDTAGNIQIMNTAAKRLFQTTGSIRNISELASFSQELVEKFIRLRTGSRDLIKIVHGAEIIQLAMYAIELNLQGKEYKLITLQNIHNELEEREMDAWQKLIRVLTHEIMNSVTPIASLATTLEGEVEYLQANNQSLNAEDLEDMHMAIKTIQRRSEGLIRFVSDFRNLTHVPIPQFKNVLVSEIFAHVVKLMEAEMKAQNIDCQVEVEPQSLMITADREMIEQVLINLVKNAIQALSDVEREDGRKILLLARYDEKSHPFIIVRDNGPGIDPDALERIFIPFFTTKKSGSGIGLSLSRQIMRSHKGSLTAHSVIGEGTEFILKF